MIFNLEIHRFPAKHCSGLLWRRIGIGFKCTYLGRRSHIAVVDIVDYLLATGPISDITAVDNFCGNAAKYRSTVV